MDATEALRRLLAGNARHAAGKHAHPNRSLDRRAQLAWRQEPWAIVFGCVDSRVAPEIVFDQGPGDLLVVRTAGEVLDDAVHASIAFGIEELAIPLVVVLGHQRCGAVTAAVAAFRDGRVDGVLARSLAPAVEEVRHDAGDVVEKAVDGNVRRVVARLREDFGSTATVVGARYALDNGMIEVIVAP